MKKVFFYTMAAAALTIASCQKEINDVPETEVAPFVETFTAVVDEPLTKADYTINGSSAEFSWNSNDAFYRLVRSYTVNGENRTYSSYNHYTYTASSASGYTATFTGGSLGDGYEDTGFALFPSTFANNGSEFGYVKNNNALKFILNEQLTYDAEHPLKNIVPMVGTLSGTEYTFKPVVGVIGIKVQNIPSTYTSITIASSSGGMSGTTVTMTSVTNSSYKTNIGNLVGASSLGLKKEWFTAGTTKTFTFNGLNPSNTYTFYFPVPVGTYTDLTITFKEGSIIKGTVEATGLNLNVTRAKVITIPTVINCNNVGLSVNLTDVLGTYYMVISSSSYSTNNKTGELVIEDSDDPSKGNVMITKFADITGKQYGVYDGYKLVFPADQLYGDNPYSNAADFPKIALDAFTGGVTDAQFNIIEPGHIKYVGDAIGFRATTQELWFNDNHNGAWPWSLAFGSLEAIRGITPIPLTESMVSVSANETSTGDNGGPAALVDGKTGTHWHSPYSFAGTYDPTYGVYIDVDLGSGNEVTKFNARFHLRNSQNDHPDHIKIYASTDGSNWGSALADVENIYTTYGQNSWTDLIPFTAASASRYVRIAILSTNGYNGAVSNLTTSGCTHMAELELYSLD